LEKRDFDRLKNTTVEKERIQNYIYLNGIKKEYGSH
jgi:hypothetical protein